LESRNPLETATEEGKMSVTEREAEGVQGKASL